MGNTTSIPDIKTTHLRIDWQQTYLNDYEHIDDENFGVKVYTIQDSTPDGFLLKSLTDILDDGNLEYEEVDEPSPVPTNLLEDLMRYTSNPLAYYDIKTNSIRTLPA